jgi:hypothetical protein
VGSTFEAKPAADAIREEIGAMAADGTLGSIAARWRSFSGRNLEMTNALYRAKGRERWLLAGITAAIIVLLLISLQAIRIRRAHAELAIALAGARQATELKGRF